MSYSQSRARLVASAAICAALYAIVNMLTSVLRTPFGVGEFRPGVVIPAFFAIVVGPIPAGVGAAVGSFISDIISLVPGGGSTPALALLAGAPANFVGFLLLGWIYNKLKSWRGFIVGTTAGLFIGNLIAAVMVVVLLNLTPPSVFITGLLLFWFGTMFPFVIILVPPLIRLMRPYASQLSTRNHYPEINEPNKRALWSWSVAVAALVIAALLVALLSESSFISNYGGPLPWEVLFVVSAVAVLIVGAFLPQISGKPKEQAGKPAVVH